MRPFIRVIPRQPVRLARPFSIARTLRLKEDVERNPEEVEQAKQDQLKDKEWKRELASGSEESVGADREHVKDDDKHMEELQKQTAQQTQENHPDAK
ncbi:hypothetical protein LTR37_015272 [Vermiconidia calcicola]|uniref:Uncharacterized protein n=1 Tax=Vermiconidia calcicola TaxID=1690605 RepID=A0ACC3MR42_9PEZI|nr:hypothetical protein LTR37_015272 [Vermiconidia calcicola]